MIFSKKIMVCRNMNHSTMLEKWFRGKYFANFYMQTGLYLCPPESSVKLSFQTLPNATFTSNPSRTVMPSGGASLALVPGSNVEKILPKSWKRKTEGYTVPTGRYWRRRNAGQFFHKNNDNLESNLIKS